jgi:hypothetical protein
MNVCKLTLIFEFGAINGGTMLLDIRCGDTRYKLNPGIDAEIEKNFSISLPNKIIIDVSGKNSEKDTLIENGKIIKDKYIRIKEIRLDSMLVPEDWINGQIRFVTHGTELYTNYFGFNGHCTIDLLKSNTFLQLMSFNKDLK